MREKIEAKRYLVFFPPLSQGLLLPRTDLGWGAKGQEEQEWKPVEPPLPPLLRAILGLGNQRREEGFPTSPSSPVPALLIQPNWKVSNFMKN